MVETDSKVQLVQEGNFYYVISPTGFDKNLIMNTYFPYFNGNQNKALSDARSFGRNRAKQFRTNLIEELQNN